MNDDHLLIRGARILTQLNEVSTVSDLSANIERGFPDTKRRQHITGTIKMTNLELIPYVGMNYLHVRSSTTGTNASTYNQSLQLLKVNFNPVDDQASTTFVGYDDATYTVEPIDLTNHNVKLKCNCLDFRFRFADYNSGDKSLVGNPPPPYPSQGLRPPVNPLRVPGLCKHLLKVVQELEMRKIVQT